MNKKLFWIVGASALAFGIAFFFPDAALASIGGLGGSGFEDKMGNLNSMLISKILPLVSILGLVYAVILALTGDGGGKARIITVIFCSMVGFLAPMIIRWVQGVVS